MFLFVCFYLFKLFSFWYDTLNSLEVIFVGILSQVKEICGLKKRFSSLLFPMTRYHGWWLPVVVYSRRGHCQWRQTSLKQSFWPFWKDQCDEHKFVCSDIVHGRRYSLKLARYIYIFADFVKWIEVKYFQCVNILWETIILPSFDFSFIFINFSNTGDGSLNLKALLT